MGQGFRVVSNVVLILLLGNLLTMTTLPTQVTTALESLIKPLKLIGVPTEEVAMIISVAIQFIPTLMEEAELIKMAQIARGTRFESKKLAERAASSPFGRADLYLRFPPGGGVGPGDGGARLSQC